MRAVDLASYELGERNHPRGTLRLADVLKLRGSGVITIDGAFP